MGSRRAYSPIQAKGSDDFLTGIPRNGGSSSDRDLGAASPGAADETELMTIWAPSSPRLKSSSTSPARATSRESTTIQRLELRNGRDSVASARYERLRASDPEINSSDIMLDKHLADGDVEDDVLELPDSDGLLRNSTAYSMIEDIRNEEANRSSVAGAALNFTNSIVGAGIIDWTVVLLVQNGKLAGRNSYLELIDFCFGRRGRTAVAFFQFVFAFGGDAIPTVLHAVFPSSTQTPWSTLTSRTSVMTISTLTIMLPLSSYRSLAALSKTSAVSMVSLAVILLSIILRAPYLPPELRGDQSLRFSLFGDGFFQAVGVISFAFVCHHNTFTIYGSLRVPTINRFATVTHLSTATSFITSLMLAWSGYWAFTDKTDGNILNNFAQDDLVINIARLCFAINMFTTYPMECFVAREVLEHFFYSNGGPHEVPFRRHVLWTVVLVLISLVIAVSTCDLGLVLELTGGMSATALAYILPPLCYIRLTAGRIWGRKKMMHVLCVIFGVSVMALSTVNTLRLFIVMEATQQPSNSPAPPAVSTSALSATPQTRRRAQEAAAAPAGTLKGSSPPPSPSKDAPFAEERPAGFLRVALSLADGMLGVSVIGFPYVLRLAGFATGTVLFLAIAFIIDRTIIVLFECGKLSGQRTYQRVVYFCFGRKGKLCVAFFQLLLGLGLFVAMCAYAVIIGNSAPQLWTTLTSKAPPQRESAIVAISSFVFLPLSLMANFTELMNLSMVSLASVMLITVSIGLRASSVPQAYRGNPDLRFSVLGHRPFEAIGIISFGMHPLFKLMCEELLGRSFTFTQRSLCTALLVMASSAMALYVHDLATILALVGSLCAASLGFVFPALCYLRLASGPIYSWKKLPKVLCVLFGLTVMATSTIQSLTHKSW
ncbi:hypothetical protein RI367_005275 [Sorochytrium milnesiophthora]